MLQNDAKKPEGLSGTNGEPALHLPEIIVTLKVSSYPTIFESKEIETFITSESLLLYCEASSSVLTIEYPHIILHAASSDPPSLYLQIEDEDTVRDLLSPDSDFAGGMIELFIIPKSGAAKNVNDMFSALSRCASMHPDPMTDNKELDDSMLTFEQQMNDPNHQWITADDVQGQFDDVEDTITEQNGHEPDQETDAPRKWRRTG